MCFIFEHDKAGCRAASAQGAEDVGNDILKKRLTVLGVSHIFHHVQFKCGGIRGGAFRHGIVKILHVDKGRKTLFERHAFCRHGIVDNLKCVFVQTVRGIAGYNNACKCNRLKQDNQYQRQQDIIFQADRLKQFFHFIKPPYLQHSLSLESVS